MAHEPGASSSANKLECTRIHIEKCYYTWTIKNFNLQINKDSRELISPAFYSGKNNEDKWRLELGLRNKDNEDHIGLYLTLVSSRRKTIDVDFCEFAILKSTSKMCKRKFQCEYNEEDSRGFKDYINMKKVDEVLDDNCLKILCKIIISSCYEEKLNEKEVNSQITTQQYLANDLRNFLVNSILADVTLLVRGTEFQAHKQILAARSRFFADKFSEELNDGIVEIGDFEPKVVEAMLHFIYTGDKSVVEENAQDLLSAADKFGIEALKAECENILLANLTEDNAVQMVFISLINHAERLHNSVMDFINSHQSNVDFKLLDELVGKFQKIKIDNS
uniref:BTB domain-containing protein n=1 Tax=Bracon brevicornis TaxID=1563983 RepID=A0A6V7I8D3_9HYME